MPSAVPVATIVPDEDVAAASETLLVIAGVTIVAEDRAKRKILRKR